MARTPISKRQAPKKAPAAAAAFLSGSATAGRDGLLSLSPAALSPNPFQPRTDFPEESLKELAASIARDGILEPLVVRPNGDGQYQIIAGERRWRAAKLAKLAQVPAVARECSDEEMELLALEENLHREDLNAMDRSRALSGLKDKLGLTWERVADRVHLSRRRVLMLAGLQDLPEDLQGLLSEGALTEKHARALGGLQGVREQRQFAKAVQAEGLSGDRAIKAAQRLQKDPERDIRAAVQSAAKPKASPKRNARTERTSKAAAQLKEALEVVEPDRLTAAERKRLAGELMALGKAVREMVEQLGGEE